MRDRATTIAFSPNELIVAQGDSEGLITICRLNKETGRKEQVLSTIEFHQIELRFIGWLSDDRVLSADTRGNIAVHTISGEKEASLSLNHEDLETIHYSLSPSGNILFVAGQFKTADEGENQFTESDELRYIQLKKKLIMEGLAEKDEEEIHALEDKKKGDEGKQRICRFTTTDFQFLDEIDFWASSGNRFYGQSDEVVLCWDTIKDRKTKVVYEQLLSLNITNGSKEVTVLPGGPDNTYHDDQSPCDIANGKIIRISFEDPVDIDGDQFTAKLELRDIASNKVEVKYSPYTITYDPKSRSRIGLNEDHVELLKGEVNLADEDYREAVTEGLFEYIRNMKISKDAKKLWFNLRNGHLRCIDLENGKQSGYVIPQSSKEIISINDLGTAYPLAISASGNYVAFDNPTQFFKADTLPLFSENKITIDKCDLVTSEEALVEPDYFTVSEKWLFWVKDSTLYLYNKEKGELALSRQIDYSNDVSVAAFSPDQNWLFLGWQGRAALLLNIEKEIKIMRLPYLGHVMNGCFTSNNSLWFLNGKACVVMYDFTEFTLYRTDYADMEVDEDEEEFDSLYDDFLYPFDEFSSPIATFEDEEDHENYDLTYPAIDFTESDRYAVYGSSISPDNNGKVFVTTEEMETFTLTIKEDEVNFKELEVESNANSVAIGKKALILHKYKSDTLVSTSFDDTILKEIPCDPTSSLAMLPGGSEFLLLRNRHDIVRINAESGEEKNLFSFKDLVDSFHPVNGNSDLAVRLKGGRLVQLSLQDANIKGSWMVTGNKESLNATTIDEPVVN